MMKNRYWFAGWTPRAGSVAIMVGRMYREVPAPWGIQSCSKRTSSFMPSKKRSGSMVAMQSRSAEEFIRLMFSRGRNR